MIISFVVEIWLVGGAVKNQSLRVINQKAHLTWLIPFDVAPPLPPPSATTQCHTSRKADRSLTNNSKQMESQPQKPAIINLEFKQTKESKKKKLPHFIIIIIFHRLRCCVCSTADPKTNKFRSLFHSLSMSIVHTIQWRVPHNMHTMARHFSKTQNKRSKQKIESPNHFDLPKTRRQWKCCEGKIANVRRRTDASTETRLR